MDDNPLWLIFNHRKALTPVNLTVRNGIKFVTTDFEILSEIDILLFICSMCIYYVGILTIIGFLQ
jgi:hypothetical protein